MIAGSRVAASLIGRGGVNPIHGGGMKVQAQGTPSLILDILSGVAFVPGTEGAKQGVYVCVNDATDTVTLDAAHGSLPRIDLVVAKVRDAVYSGVSNDWLIDKVTGTAAGSPVAPTAPVNSITLATVNRTAADDTVSNSDIVDSRTFVTGVGGIIICTASTRPGITTVAIGQAIYETDTQRFAFSDGSTYVDTIMAANFSTTDVQVFTASGTWTKPTGAQRVRVQCQAGGGGGGSADTTAAGQTSAGAGGQGGGYAESWFNASTLSGTETVTRGAGGAGGTGGGNGGTGVDSSFGSHVVAAGGLGGTVLIASATPLHGQGGGSTQSMTGSIQVNGSGGGGAARFGAAGAIGGHGGSAFLGGGAWATATGAVGSAGRQYGGGGSGAANNPSSAARAGGAGANGVIIVTTYI